MYHPDYEYISIDGIENAMHVLDNIDDLSGVFFEMSSCDFSCVNGPASTFNNKAVIKSVEKVRKYARGRYDKDINHSLNDVDISAEFKKQDITYLTPSEYEIQELLKKINKTKKEHELNCGACGYQTCRAKAAAVYNGLSNIYTCLPYMNDLAEKMNEEVIHYSPNGIITFDEDNNIININDKAKEMFGINTPEVSLGYFRDYLPWDDLSLGFINQKNVIEKESYIEKTKKYVEYSLVFVKQNKMSFCLLRDITIHKEYEKQLNQNQKELINTTNSVIEKQMRVVQEIASLLGETTAETKVALIKLRDQFVNKDGE
jgi:PAS domain S-box-containing protein